MAFNRKQPVGPTKPASGTKPTKVPSPKKPVKPVKSVIKGSSQKQASKTPLGAKSAPKKVNLASTPPMGMGQRPVPFVHPQLGPGVFIPMSGQGAGTPPPIPQMGPPPMPGPQTTAPQLSPPGVARPLGGVPPMLNSAAKPGLPGGMRPQI